MCGKEEDASEEEQKAIIVNFNLNFQVRKLLARQEVLDFYFDLLKSA